MTKVAIYARCSTTEQFVTNQLEALRKYATERGFEVVAEYSENKSGWKDGHQLELIHLVDDAKRRKFNGVLVWSLDRLSRGGPAKVLTLVNSLNACDVGVISYQQPWIEASGPLRELLYSLTAWVASFESELRSERTKAGLVRARAGGQVLGRPQGSTDKRKRSRRGYFKRYAE
jgi:DNA invertase Pin-like site-specific DNA recombinase